VDDNIKIDLMQIVWDGMDWIDLAQDKDQRRALVKTVMNLRVPYNSWKFLSGCTVGSFSRRAQLRKYSFITLFDGIVSPQSLYACEEG
jgi:hypothetical protein